MNKNIQGDFQICMSVPLTEIWKETSSIFLNTTMTYLTLNIIAIFKKNSYSILVKSLSVQNITTSNIRQSIHD